MSSRSASPESALHLFATCNRQEGKQRTRRTSHGSSSSCNSITSSSRQRWRCSDGLLEPRLDFLGAFQSGHFHDCTIRVGCDLRDAQSPFQEFKCHKVILGASSVVLDALFSSVFVEAQKGPQQPILLDKVHPQVFETALKFIYGNVSSEFRDFEFAVQVFEFAVKMNMRPLMEALQHFLHHLPPVAPICAIFDAHLAAANQTAVAICKKRATREALRSQQWCTMSLEGVQQVLRLEPLSCDEAEVLGAVARWGRDRPRPHVLACLRLVRFVGVSGAQFAHLCSRHLQSTMTLPERHAVLLALLTNRWASAPPFVDATLKKRAAHAHVITYSTSSAE